MQQNTERAFSAYDSRTAQEIESLVDTVTTALDSVGADSDVIEDIEQQGQRTAEAAEDELQEKDNEIEELQEKIESEGDRRSAEIEGCHNRISGLEEEIEEANPTPDTGETTIQQSDLTPAEQLSRADDISDVTDSPTVERAVSLFKNINQWGSKTPKGVVLKPTDNPLSLLEADRDEQLAWKQYYRACEALERLSHGSVTFFDSDRHGKMLVLHKQSDAYERVVNGSLSPSSVGAEG